jgi:Flp pilus assembly protein TadG
MKRRARQWWKDERGSVFVIGALVALGVTGAVGLAIDAGRAQMVQNKLQTAVDAAGLAAGSSLSVQDLNPIVKKYIAINMARGNLGATIADSDINVQVSEDEKLITITAAAQLPTTFMKLFGHDQVALHANTEITRTNKGMELALVLDITGSMWSNNNHLKLRNAANSLVDILYGKDATGNYKDKVDNLWISVVPYVTSVNIGSQSKATSWLTSYDLTRYPASWPSTTTKWKGCIEERASTLDTSDDAPVAGSSAAQIATRWPMYFWASTGGAPTGTVKTFSANPVNNDTVNVNGVLWKFVTGTPAANQTKIKSSLSATLTQLATDLNASTNAAITGATYSSDSTKLKATNNGDNYWYNAATGTVTLYEAVDYKDSGTGAGLGPNISCGESVLALTASRATVVNKINSLYPWRKSGTMSNVGLAWGWRMLSPKWRGLWDADKVNGLNSLPLDYNTPLMQKVVVIETDGNNNFFKSASTTPPYSDYSGMLRLNTTANGGRADINTTNNASGITKLNQKTSDICTAMKQQGILIYTITFGLGTSSTEEAARTTFRNCATQPSYYFDATDETDLTSAFKTIGDSLANLRISK